MGLILAAVFAASAYDQVFDQGVAAYNEKTYPAAISAFEKLVSEGVTQKEVFFNLGNAYYRNGQLAPAIVNYERALQLDPGAEVVRENLARAVGQTERGMPRPRPPAWEEGFFFWHAGHTAGTSLAIAAIAWVLGWTLIIVRGVRPWPYVRLCAAIALAASFLFGASWWIKIHPTQLAVAAAERVPVRYGNRPGETVRFELLEGDRVRVEQRKDGWARVLTSDGERGWAEDKNLLFVGPPFESYRWTEPPSIAASTAGAKPPSATSEGQLKAVGYGKSVAASTAGTKP